MDGSFKIIQGKQLKPDSSIRAMTSSYFVFIIRMADSLIMLFW